MNDYAGAGFPALKCRNFWRRWNFGIGVCRGTSYIGVGLLAIEFEGVLNDKMKGFYRR